MAVQSGTRGTDIDQVFDVLADPKRRSILLEVHAGTVEDEDDLSGRTDGDRIELRHHHLPKLRDHGYIEWDPEQGSITRGPNFEEIAAVIGLLDDHQHELPQSWP